MNLAEWLVRAATARPQAPAVLLGPDTLWTYGELQSRVARLAGGLAETAGVRVGDRVGLWMSNRPEYLLCLYAIHWAGAVAVPINSKLHAAEAAWILADAEAGTVFTDQVGVELHVATVDVAGQGFGAISGAAPAEAPAPRGGDDLAWLFYTSGTTGRPKGVMLTNANLVAMSLAYLADVDAVETEDAAVYAAPMSHGAGLYNYVHMLRGARHLFPESRGFDADELLDLAVVGPLSMFAAPTMVRRLVEAAERRDHDGDGIKTIVYGGGPMYLADIQAALQRLGPRFVQIYGQGESPMTITALSREAHAPGADQVRRLATVGRAHCVVEVRVVDEAGQILPPDTAGEVEVKGLTVMAGYWRNEEATRGSLDGGWLRTGDIGRLDAEGHLTLTDRSKDVIITGGSNVYPREVEEVLLTHPAVSEVAVVAQVDPEWGECVVAFIVPRDREVATGELEALCLSRLARYKRPKRYIPVAALPKNNYGKVLKTELRRRLKEPAR